MPRVPMAQNYTACEPRGGPPATVPSMGQLKRGDVVTIRVLPDKGY